MGASAILTSWTSGRSGTWSVFVEQADAGSHYKFLLRRGGPYRWRIDPFARQVTHSRGDAVVFDGRNLYNPADIGRLGFAYFCIGKGA